MSNQADARIEVREDLTKDQAYAFTKARRDGNRAQVYKRAQ
jgi:hypothetical protein